MKSGVRSLTSVRRWDSDEGEELEEDEGRGPDRTGSGEGGEVCKTRQ